MDLLDTEIRALGCLIEKQRTTPDAYPLTLNSLRLACNQSTNRDPVVSYQESDLRDALHRLERRGLVRFASGAGSRAAKYRHLLAERLPMDDAEQALMCVLMLRGPQTPGELKQRADRMHAFASLADVDDALQTLIERGLVARLPRRPGQKEERYGQLLGVETDAESEPRQAAISPDRPQAAVEVTRDPAGETRPDAQGGGRVDVHPLSAPEGDLGAEIEADRSATRSDVLAAAGRADGQLAQELQDLRERVALLERELESLKAELGVEVWR